MEQPCIPVHVAVSGLNGDTLHLTTNLRIDVGNLKQQIMDHWGIPPTFQRVVFSLDTLQFAPEISACLALGMDELRERIRTQPVRAVQDLVQLPCAYKVEDEIFNLIGDAFNNGPAWPSDLEQTLGEGDEALLDRVIDTALHLCSHARASIKFAALRALYWKVYVRAWSDARLDTAVATAVELSRDADAYVRWASVSFLKAQNKPEHLDRTIAIALELCRDNDIFVKRAALCTLSKKAFQTSEAIIDALCACAVDLDTEVRLTAWVVLRKIASKNDRKVVDVAAACVNDAHPDVQFSALAFSFNGSRTAAVNACLFHDNITIRHTALSVLEKMKCDVEGETGKRARAHSDHEEAVSCFLEAACLDDATVALFACKLLQDSALDIRNRALNLLSRFAIPNNEAVVHAVCSGLSHVSGGVQESALRAMPLVASKGNDILISALCTWLLPGKTSALRALNLLFDLVEPGDPTAVHTVRKCLDDDRDAVRELAQRLLEEWRA